MENRFKNAQKIFNVIDKLKQDLEKAMTITYLNFRLNIVHYPNTQIHWHLRHENVEFPMQLFRIADNRTQLMLNNVLDFDITVLNEEKAVLFKLVKQDLNCLKETIRGYINLENLDKKEILK